MITAIIILGCMVVIFGYTTFNLLRKNERQEDIVAGYLIYLDQVSKAIEYADEKMEQIDSKGIFKSDDEIGFMYEEVKGIQKVLSNFRMDKI